MSQPNFLISQALHFGWRAFKKDYAYFIGLILIVIAVQAGFALLAAVLHLNTVNFGDPAYVGYTLANWIISILIGIGLVRIAIGFNRGEKASYTHLYKHYNLIIKYVLATIVYWLIVLAGFILFVFPAFIWGMKFYFYTYLIVDKGLGPIAALKESARVTNGAKWEVFGFMIVSAIVNILGILALVVGIFATIPTVLIATGFVYDKLKNREGL